VAPRYGDRNGGYLRIVRTGFQQGDGAEKAFIELLGAEKQLEVKRQKRADLKAKKRAELEKQLEEQKKEARRNPKAANRLPKDPPRCLVANSHSLRKGGRTLESDARFAFAAPKRPMFCSTFSGVRRQTT
jgi:hypothetical protein